MLGMEPASHNPEVSVVAPAYNEAESIAGVVRDWIQVLEGAGVSWEIVISNDGSSDNTGEVLKGMGEPRLRVLEFENNGGYGHALSQAMRAARGDYVVTIDSDGQFDLADFPPLLGQLKEGGLDLVTGYRRKKKDSLIKVAADRVLNLIVRMTFGLSLRDTNCALKVMTKKAAHEIEIEARGFPTPTEIVAKASMCGMKLGEGPVEHRERAAGQSKLKAFQSALDFLQFLFYLRLQFFLAKRGVLQRRHK